MPYHADVIGSLLRPRYLSEARAALAAGRISNEEYKRIETARSTRRSPCRKPSGSTWSTTGSCAASPSLITCSGTWTSGRHARRGGALPRPGSRAGLGIHPPLTVTGRIRPKGPMMTIEEFSYARGRARVPVKITMPSPGPIQRVVTGAFPVGLL